MARRGSVTMHGTGFRVVRGSRRHRSTVIVGRTRTDGLSDRRWIRRRRIAVFRECNVFLDGRSYCCRGCGGFLGGTGDVPRLFNIVCWDETELPIEPTKNPIRVSGIVDVYNIILIER